MPGVVQSLQLPGFNLDLQEAKILNEETKELSLALAETTLRLAFQTTGWLDLSKEYTERQDRLVEVALNLLSASKTPLSENARLEELYYTQLCNEYIAFISYTESGSKKIRLHELGVYSRTYPSKEHLATPDEVTSALAECSMLNEKRQAYLALYRYFYLKRTHLDIDEWKQRYTWIVNDYSGS